jgi:phosphomannomutase/glucose-6-phosphate isomerase
VSAKIRKIFSLALTLSLIFQQIGFAQVATQLNIGNYLIAGANSAVSQDKFRPVHLRYFSYNNLNDNFKIILDKGDLKTRELGTKKIKSQAQELLNYFLIGVTLPDSMFWVNLRPDAEGNIIDAQLARTDIGKVMLEADLQLKKDTAAFTSSQTVAGKEYWSKLYKKAGELYGNNVANIPTLTRPWIVPGEIIVRESKDSAYVYKANLKVMLEQDVLKKSAAYNFKDQRAQALNEYSSQLIRELVIPKLTKEVNFSKRYAPLRQVYYSLILARWFKLSFANKSGTYAALINAKNLTNLVSKEVWSKTEYFKQYQKSFTKGEYNEKEQVYTPNGQVMRSYFSGGINMESIQTDGFVDDKSGEVPPGPMLAGNAGADNSLQTAEESNRALVDQELQPYLSKLDQDKFEKQFTSLFGMSYEEVKAVNPYLAKIAFDGMSSRLGWTTAILEWIAQNPDKLQNVLADGKFIRENFKYVIFCGMGGSGLSVQAAKETFGEKGVKIYSLRTTDPQAISDILSEITSLEGGLAQALEKTLIIPISKSGTTQETVSHKKYFEDLLGQFSIDAKKHLWVVTDKGSPMDTGDYTQREIQLNSKGDIGGRFTSPTTNIFLLPLAIIAPERVSDILKLAKEMNVIGNINQDNFLKLGAYLYYLAAKKGKDKLTMIMPDELSGIPSWSEQLFEESLGKDGKGITLFYGEKITPQVLKAESENDRVFFRVNIGDKKTNQELWDYLEANNYPVFEINIKDVDAVGGIMLGFQRTVAAVGYLWDICFVNQPAVEGYKKATREVMQSIQPGESVQAPASWKYTTYNQLKLYYTPLVEAGIITEIQLETEVKRLGYSLDNAPAVYAAIINLLKLKGNFEAAELTSYGRMTSGLRSILEDVRYNLFTNGLKMPAKLGEGPDKNHSYHQNIEAGKDMWFSTYFMAKKIGQPKALAFDDNLLKAQAIGTAKSLVSAKRSVVLIVFDGTTEAAEPDVKEFFSQVSKIIDSQNQDVLVPEDALGLFKEQVNSYMYEGEPIISNALPKEVLDIYQDSDLLWTMNKNNLEGVKTVTLNPKTASAVKFGTSGDRGTFDDTNPDKRFNVQRTLRVAQGIADYYNNNRLQGVVTIGYDNRLLSREYAYLTAAVLAANNIQAELTLSATPVPVVAFAVASSQAAAQPRAGGIVITASHNPWEYNGIKWVLPNGGAAPANITNQIQDAARVATQVKIMPVVMAFKNNYLTLVDFKEDYVNYVIGGLPEEGKDKIKQWGDNLNNSVVINPMQGAGIGYLRAIVQKLGIKNVKEVNTKIDRLFGQVNNAPNPDSAEDFDLDIFQANKTGKQIVELLQDGDADRFGVRDVNGERFSANELIPLIGAFLWEKGYRGKIGKTVATSNFSNAVDASHSQSTLETDTGFKNLVDALESGEFLVVGEESAHVGVGLFKESKDDGLAVGLMSLWIIAEKGSLTSYQKEVETKLGKHFKYKRIDTAYSEKAGLVEKGQQMVDLIDLPQAATVVQNTLDNETFEFKYAGNESLFAKFNIIDQKIQDLAKSNGGIAKILICYDKAAKKSSGYKIIFGNDNWIAIRVSGTGEPVIRLYVEVVSSCDSGNWEDVHEQSVKTWQAFAQTARDAIGLVKIAETIGSISFISDVLGNRAIIKIKGQNDYEESADNLSLGEFKMQILNSLRQKYGVDVNLLFVLTRGDQVVYDITKEASQVLADDDGGPISSEGENDLALKNASSLGGIDFRGFPPAIQPMGSFKGLNFKLPRLNSAELAQINVDAELGEIRNMLKFGMLPSGQRIKELVAACQQKKEIGYRLDSLLLCLTDTFKLEEENALESSPELREALVVVEANN